MLKKISDDYVKDSHLMKSGLKNESDSKIAFTRFFEYIYMNYSPKYMAELLYKLTLEGVFSVAKIEF
ncbi:hypothetical protein [Staphylococcus schweitzeri]|uniref:hypothetical protein n=2 Tax=Staphylococcus schweitzeri TaxID=1654388 RepID=UPI001E4DF695|nr:hypothetical protein [Staphylococcus schweitzeri]